MDGEYRMVPHGEYLELRDKAERLDALRGMADAGEMPRYEQMGFEDLVDAARWLWWLNARRESAIRAALADLRTAAFSLERFALGKGMEP